MRRVGSRTADGWWLLLITVLGWLLVSYGSHHIFGGEDSQQSDIVRRQLQTVVSTNLSPVSIASSPSPTSTKSPANVATTLSPTTNLTAIIADQMATSPSSSPAETATPEATAAGTPAPTVSTVNVVTATPSPNATPTPVSLSPSPTPNSAATPQVTASPTSTPTAAATVAAAVATPAATPAATVAATASPSPTPTPTPTLSPTPAPTVATVATPTPSPTPAPTTATVATPTPTPSPTPAASLTPGSPSPSSPVATEPESTPSPFPLPASTYLPSPTPVPPSSSISTPTPGAMPSPTPPAVSSPTLTASPTPAATLPSVLPSPAATDAPSPVTASPSSPDATAIPTPASTASSTPVATPPATVSSSPIATLPSSPSAPVLATPTPRTSPSPSLSPSSVSVASPAASPAAPTATSPPVAVATPTPTPSRTPAPTLAATASPTAAASPTPSPTFTPTPTPSPVPAVTPTVTPAAIPTLSSSPVQQSSTSVNASSPSPSALPQGTFVPAKAPSSSNISADSPSSADVAPGPGTSSQGTTALAPSPDAGDYGLDTPAPAPSASNVTQNTTAPAIAPAAASPTAAVTTPVPAPPPLTTVNNSTAPVPAPFQPNAAVPAPAPGLSRNATAPAPGQVAVPGPAPGAPAPAPALTSGVPVPAPAQGAPAPAPAVGVPAPAAAVPVPAPAASTPAAGTPSNASAPAPGSVTAGPSGSESSNSTVGTPATAPAPSTVAVPVPATSAPAMAPSVGDPDLPPVSTSQIEYRDVATAPASWNATAYNTTAFQVLLTNTSVGEFDSPAQIAVMNVVHSYLVANGFAEPFYMGLASINQYLPTSDVAPGVSINISRSAAPATRHLLQDMSDDGVNLTVTITAPASQMHNVSDLVQSVVQSPSVRRQLQEAGVGANIAAVSVVVEIQGLPALTVPVADLTSPAMVAPSPPAASNKSSSIGPIAGGIAGGVVVIVGGAGLLFFLCKRRSRRRQWTKDLEVAKAGYGEDGTSNSGDSGSSGGSARPGGLGRKVAAYMPFGTNSNESVDATPHAKHARMDDGFAGISRFKPDGTLKVPPPRQPHLISSAAAAAAAVPGQMGTILERKTFSAPPAQPGGANLHDTANLMDSHSNNVQTAAEHAMLSPTSLFSFGTPIGRHSDPFRPPGLPSRQSDGRLSSDGSANLLLRGGSGDQLLGVQASGEYSDRFQELEPMGVRKASRQYSGSVDANLWSVAWKDLEIQKQIGEGSFGKVFLAKWRETTVAVKLLTYTGVSGSLEDNDEFVAQGMNVLLKGLEQEASMMASMRHPNVVMYLGVCLQPPCVVTEYCARGSLNDVFKRARATPALAAQLDWGRRLNMVLDAAKGMMYLHSSEPPVIHRDLKSPNLLVDKHWRLKVCDFNLSRVMEESAILSSMAASNPRWLAPEILSGRGYTFSSDVYSFGVIMWEFLTWQIPWHECGPWQVVALVTEGAQRPELPAPNDLPGTGTFAGFSEYIMLMEQCWHQDPAARPTFAQVITVLRKLLGAEMKAKASNNAELRPQSSSTPSD